MQPAVSIGNVGQLALDLLINTSAAACTARLQTACLLPCVGRGAYDHQPEQSIATPLELYVPEDDRVAYLQQRSPAAPGQQAAFAEQLAEQLHEVHPDEVRLLLLPRHLSLPSHLAAAVVGTWDAGCDSGQPRCSWPI